MCARSVDLPSRGVLPSWNVIELRDLMERSEPNELRNRRVIPARGRRAS